MFNKVVRAAGRATGFSLQEVLDRVRTGRELGTTEQWFTQYFLDDVSLVGLLEWDVCFQYTPMEMRKYMAKTTMMQIRVPPELHKWFKKFCQSREVTMTEIVIGYIRRLESRHTDVKIEQVENL